MFEIIPRQFSDEATSIWTAQMSSWAAMNLSILGGTKAMGELNLGTACQMLSDTAAALKFSGRPENAKAPRWARFCYIPEDAGSFLLYGRQAKNICSMVQNDILKFAHGSYVEATRDIPWLSKYVNTRAETKKMFEHMFHAGERV